MIEELIVVKNIQECELVVIEEFNLLELKVIKLNCCQLWYLIVLGYCLCYCVELSGVN